MNEYSYVDVTVDKKGNWFARGIRRFIRLQGPPRELTVKRCHTQCRALSYPLLCSKGKFLG